jgi:ribosome-binding protein aMBF1 (putative translation factor)
MLQATMGRAKSKASIDSKRRRFIAAAHLLGYLIPWYFVRQLGTITGMAKPSPSHAGDKVLKSLGDAIRLTRAEKGLSQEALAVDAELDRSYVGGIERGEHNVTIINLNKVAKALGLPISALLIKAGL